MWTLGVLIWLPIAALLTLLGVGALVVMHFIERDEEDMYGPHSWRVPRVIASALLTLLITGTAFGLYPYKADYHKWDTKDGTIAEISKRLVGDGDGMQEKFVVVFEGSGQQYGCLDTRCALLDPGDYLKLACKKEFEYGATDGWDCKFRESREDGDA